MNRKNNTSMQLFAETPNGEDVVSMVVHKNKLIVATASNVYQLSEDGVFTVIKFEGVLNE